MLLLSARISAKAVSWSSPSSVNRTGRQPKGLRAESGEAAGGAEGEAKGAEEEGGAEELLQASCVQNPDSNSTLALRERDARAAPGSCESWPWLGRPGGRSLGGPSPSYPQVESKTSGRGLVSVTSGTRVSAGPGAEAVGVRQDEASSSSATSPSSSSASCRGAAAWRLEGVFPGPAGSCGPAFSCFGVKSTFA